MLIGVYITAGRPLEAVTFFDEFRRLDHPISAIPDALNWEGTNARMCGRMADSLAFYAHVRQLDDRAGSLGHSTAVGGHALSAFEAGVAGPDEERLAQILHQAIADQDSMGIAMAQLRIGFRAARLDDAQCAVVAFEAARAAMPGTLWAAWADAALVPIHDQLDQLDEMRAAIQRLRGTGQPLRLVLADLGDAADALRNDNPNDAETAAHQVLTGASQHGLVAQLAVGFEVLADASSRLGDDRHAARLLGAAHRLRDELGAHGIYPINAQRRAATTCRLRQNLTDSGYNEAFAEGVTLPWPDAVAYAQRTRGERKRPGFGWDAVTPTEHRVIQLAVEGLTNAQIASQLLMGTETVKTHLSHIYTKLGVKNRAQLATAVADGSRSRDI
jgi:DNA-binding CsgD family transcriptional regulator